MQTDKEVRMKKLLILAVCGALCALLCVSCEEEPTKQETPEVATAIFVLNSGGQSISVIDLDSNKVFQNVATVGTSPNQLVYKDGKLYCVNSGSNNIMVFDTEHNYAAETPIALGASNNPTNLVFVGDNTLYVACLMSNKVLKVNLATKTVTGEITTGVGTTGIIYHNNKVYAANTAFNGTTYTYGQGTVQVINPGTDAVVKTIDVPTNPFDLKPAADGKIHVVCVGNWIIPGKIAIIDPTTDTYVDSIAIIGSPTIIDIDKINNIGYLSVYSFGLVSYNTATKAILHEPAAPLFSKNVSGVLVDFDSNVYVSVWDDDQVVKLDKDGNTLATYNVGDKPSAMALKVE